MNYVELEEPHILPNTSRKQSSFSSNPPNPARPLRVLAARREALSKKHNNTSIPEADADQGTTTTTAAAAPDVSSDYGYLKHIQSFKPLCHPDDKSLPKKVR